MSYTWRAGDDPHDTSAGFSVHPAGPYPHSGYQVLGLFLLGTFPVLSLTACCLRIGSRRVSHGLGLGVCRSREQYWQRSICERDTGVFMTPIFQATRQPGPLLGLPDRVFYRPLLVIVKISALLFLLRLGGVKKSIHCSCRALITFNVAQLCAFCPATIFQCTPVEYTWKGVAQGRCFPAAEFAVILAITNILTDILTLLVPTIAFKDLKLGHRIRWALTGVFALGAIVTILSCVRLYTIPLARLYFPGVFESMGINRPYLVPDIEVRATPMTSTSGGPPHARILWLSRPRTPCSVGQNGDGHTSVALTVMQSQRASRLGATAARYQHASNGDGDEDLFDDDYHDMMRKMADTHDACGQE
ncbi:hypothetical protein QBC35DRAFT_469850 [Podospora australis]|uniref:Rhodopsin domain-containing protein n=1 Tax=Podospora australis TaxID=1536484 RepID=A0AAN7AKX9_9PEZI|nr:hypothetical protein QBC35DRAFT_469850 [Podospora australis]